MAVWIWGFFGSGKSHVAKVLGYLLENDVVDPKGNRRAIDVFALHLDDPTLANAMDLKASIAEIRNNAWCKTIAFEIKSKQDQANPESITEACLRSFYESLGLSSTIWLARLERKLQVEERYDDFVAAYRDQTKREWSQDRPEHGYYLDEINSALATATGRTTESAASTIEAYQRDHSRISPEVLVDELAAYLKGREQETKPREPHVVFVIDEMGQFIADKAERIHELQAIIEQGGSRAGGRIWFLCTAQEALDQVVDRSGLKLSQLGKLEARFSTRIPLTSEDVRRVVQDRLLRKREDKLPALDAIYSSHEGSIVDLCDLRLERNLATVSKESFTQSYPFLPYTVPLLQELFNGMRGFKLSGAERSMIGLAYGALRTLAGAPLGSIASLDLAFDQVTDELSSADYLGTTGIKAIRESDARVQGWKLAPSKVLKALWLVSRVEWVPRTAEVLARVLAGALEVDLAALRGDVQDTLKLLQKGGYVGLDEASGQYRYLSEKERGLEEAIADEISDYGVGVAKRVAVRILKERVLTAAKLGYYKVQLGKSSQVPFALHADDDVVTNSGEMIVKLYSPLASPDLPAIERENTAQGTKGRTLWWISSDEPSLVDRLKRIEALEKVPEQKNWRSDRSDETLRLLKEKERERTSLEGIVASSLESCLKRGRLLYSGEDATLSGAKDLRGIAGEFVGSVAGNLFQRFAPADRIFDERNTPSYLKTNIKNVDRLDPELGLFDTQGNLVRSNPLVEALFEELARRRDEDLDLDGKAIVEYFERIPFGWPEALIRLVLAAMLRGDAVHLETPDSDQPIFEIGAPGLEAIFTGGQKFRRARFIPTVGGLTPPEVAEAKQVLINLGEVSVPDTAHGLAARIRACSDRFVAEAGRVAQRVRDLGLPLPETYLRVEPVTQPAASQRDPVACVRAFVASKDAWKEVGAFLAAYSQFVEHHRDSAFRDYARLVEYVRACPEVFAEQTGETARAHLAEFDAILTSREVMAKWPVLQNAAVGLADRYRELYRQAHESCAQAVAALKNDVTSGEAFGKLEDGRRSALLARHFSPGAPLALAELPPLNTAADLANVSSIRKISEFNTLRMALAGYRDAILAGCEEELERQQAEAPTTPDQSRKPRRKTVHLSLRNKLAGKSFSSQAEFDQFWQDLAIEIRKSFDDGVDVRLEV